MCRLLWSLKRTVQCTFSVLTTLAFVDQHILLIDRYFSARIAVRTSMHAPLTTNMRQSHLPCSREIHSRHPLCTLYHATVIGYTPHLADCVHRLAPYFPCSCHSYGRLARVVSFASTVVGTLPQLAWIHLPSVQCRQL